MWRVCQSGVSTTNTFLGPPPEPLAGSSCPDLGRASDSLSREARLRQLLAVRVKGIARMRDEEVLRPQPLLKTSPSKTFRAKSLCAIETTYGKTLRVPKHHSNLKAKVLALLARRGVPAGDADFVHVVRHGEKATSTSYGTRPWTEQLSDLLLEPSGQPIDWKNRPGQEREQQKTQKKEQFYQRLLLCQLQVEHDCCGPHRSVRAGGLQVLLGDDSGLRRERGQVLHGSLLRLVSRMDVRTARAFFLHSEDCNACFTVHISHEKKLAQFSFVVRGPGRRERSPNR